MPEIPRTRFEEFDIGRALAIIGLPTVHILEDFDAVGALPSGFFESHTFLLVLSAFGAPLFMACLGANIVFSRRSSASYLARRGLQLLILGVVLNLLRYGLPDLVFGTMAGGNYTTGTWLYLVIAGCDIYDFAGLCFLSFALFKKLDLNPRQVIVVSVVALLFGAYLLPYFFASPENTLAHRLMGRFFWMNENSWFPLLNWLIFPAVGYYFGDWFKSLETDEDRTKMIKPMLPVGMAVLALSVIAIELLGENPLLVYASPANDYITDVPNVIMVIATLACVFPLLNQMALRLQGTRLLDWFVWLSAGIIPYYVAQWVFVGWMEIAITDFGLSGTFLLNEASFWLLSIVVILASMLVVKAWGVLKARRKSDCGNS